MKSGRFYSCKRNRSRLELKDNARFRKKKGELLHFVIHLTDNKAVNGAKERTVQYVIHNTASVRTDHIAFTPHPSSALY